MRSFLWMNWSPLYEIIYFLAIALVCLRIVYDTRSTTKTLAYLMLVLFVPIYGAIFYFSFGVNYRKRKIYGQKLANDAKLAKQLAETISDHSIDPMKQGGKPVERNKELAHMLTKDSRSALTTGNAVQLLVNGEKKFPEVLKAIREARHHIHIEYYIYKDDEIGREIEALLHQKAQEGVEVRFIYDDFGSFSIRRKLLPRLKPTAVLAYPFYKVRIWALANRLNYRNHRKIIVIDGQIGFVGGINVSDKYVNQVTGKKKLFWRDTHLRLEGPGVHYLQYLFISDWNFCAKEKLRPSAPYFPESVKAKGNKVVQIAASGPDSDSPTVLYAFLQAIHLANEEILITTPYFIPGDSIIDALIVAAMGGVSVKLLVPGVSDSKIVDAAARSYYHDLLDAGVEVYLYQSGFVHAKTMVTDRNLSIVGTANMDYRSFDLNFEVNAIVYDEEIARELVDVFHADIKKAKKINVNQWKKRPWHKFLLEKIARLLSPLL